MAYRARDPYRQNAFRVLGALPTSTRTELNRRKADLALFGDEQAAEEALAALLSPQGRLDAELHWFPQTAQGEIDRLWSTLDGAGEVPGKMPLLDSPSVIAQFGCARLFLETLPAGSPSSIEAMLCGLAVVADALLPGQVVEELNADRLRAGVAQLEGPMDVEDALADLLVESVRALTRRLPATTGSVALSRMEDALRRAYTRDDSALHNSFLIELATNELEVLVRGARDVDR